ncbi:uncharacterized protein LOC133529601 [Cydia pomonella]|uniref:uncharacterized protein LOC133529601 n=1 Tax=Cydia pomonella TaxID=82600 RepID=UPI002ADD867F|nr:uncharacterized protein LOC133529601 [Cydia pomonella]
MLKLIVFLTPCILMFLCPISSVKLPEELNVLKRYNNTAVEDDTSHCMEEFRHCLNPHIISPVCALNSLTDTKHPFASICEMIHENCRSKKEQWHYISDNLALCNGTFGNFTILRKKKNN